MLIKTLEISGISFRFKSRVKC